MGTLLILVVDSIHFSTFRRLLVRRKGKIPVGIKVLPFIIRTILNGRIDIPFGSNIIP